MTKNTKSPLFKIALLSISILLMMGPAVSTTVPSMTKTLSHESSSAIEAIISIPNFGLIFGILIGGFLAIHWGAKHTVLLGVAGVFVFGIIPVFTDNYIILLISRFILGVSFGLYNSLAISLISEYYSGNELSTMMGYQSAVQSLGNSVFTFLVGYLLMFSWHASYWIYAIALPILFLFGSVIPNSNPAETTNQNGEQTKAKQRVNLQVILISFITFFVFGFFMVLTVKLASIFTTEKIGTASEASAVLAVYTLLAMVIGFVYGKVHKLMGKTVLPVGLIVMAIGFVGVSIFDSFWGVTISVLVVGLGYSISSPYLFTLVTLVAPQGSKNMASSVMLIILNIGVFIGPIWVNGLASLMGLKSSASEMIICAIGLAIIAILVILGQIKNKGTVPNN